MGQKWTPEQKQAARERYQAKVEATKTKTLETKDETLMDQVFAAEAAGDLNPEPQQVLPETDHDYIERMVEEMVKAKLAQMGAMQQPTPQPWGNGLHIGGQGQLVGTREKYILDPKHYPDPRDRLSAEPVLKRFAFDENYALRWIVEVSSYPTKDGINTKEPRFTLELLRVMFDDDTGLPTNKRYVIRRAIFHEDPEAALAIASEKGYEVDQTHEKEFLDEMRYIRMRDWLLEAFYPAKPKEEDHKQEMVIGNRVVDVFTTNGENVQKIPFDEIERAKF